MRSVMCGKRDGGQEEQEDQAVRLRSWPTTSEPIRVDEATLSALSLRTAACVRSKRGRTPWTLKCRAEALVVSACCEARCWRKEPVDEIEACEA
jgi:hypothetical protein